MKRAIFFLCSLLSPSVFAFIIPQHVPVAPYGSEKVVPGTADTGPSAGSTSYEFLVKGHVYRIRQTGDISSFRVYLGSTASVTGLTLKIWRTAGGGTYTLVGESETFSSLTANSVNLFSLSSPISAQIGDYVGLRLTYTSSSGSNFDKTTALRANTTFGATAKDTINESVIVYSTTNFAPATGHNWESSPNYLTNEVIKIQVEMSAPDAVFYGDSITSGRFGSYAFSDDAQALYVATSGWVTQVAATEGITFQNIGRSGRTSANLKDEFPATVLPLLPKYVIIMCGINDATTVASTGTTVSNVTSMLNYTVSIGAIPIIVGITPIAPHGANNTYYRKIDALNVAYQALVTAAPYNGYFVDTSDMGQYYSSGDPGNLWQLKTGYATGTDNVHLSDTGNEALAAIISAALTLSPASGTSNSSSATGGTISYDGLYTIHTFTSGGTLSLTNSLEAEILVVGGGGGGGAYWGGGGGAGGLFYARTTLTSGNYSVTIGTGGVGGTVAGTNNGSGGGPSVFGSTSVYGGGYGAYADVGQNGGSGGGGGTVGASGKAGGTATSALQGNNGGSGGVAGSGYSCGGGGGFVSVGAAATSSGGNGGEGFLLGISGLSRFYGAGGGGGIRTGTGGSGGSGVGGNGGLGDSGSNNGGTAVANSGSGGGGGGGAGAAQSGGAGSDGVVIVRYLTPDLTPVASGGRVRQFYPFTNYPFLWRGWKP